MNQTPSMRMAIDVGIVVADLERALSFYRDRVGLVVVAELSTSLIGKGRMVQLQHGASRIKLVELAATPSVAVPSDIAAALGYRYITLLIADVVGMIAKLAASGVRVVVPVTQLDNGAVIAMVEDPDGNVVEFVQENA
ncbi:MAG: VOC family protein [Cyanobacteria bacterium P01_D01_bin.14]